MQSLLCLWKLFLTLSNDIVTHQPSLVAHSRSALYLQHFYKHLVLHGFKIVDCSSIPSSYSITLLYFTKLFALLLHPNQACIVAVLNVYYFINTSNWKVCWSSDSTLTLSRSLRLIAIQLMRRTVYCVTSSKPQQVLLS